MVGGRTNPSSSEPGLVDDVLEHVRAGRWIHAIKLYRETTGCGLKEAKDAVESLARSAGIPVTTNSGCGPAAFMLLAGGVILAITAGVGAAVYFALR